MRSHPSALRREITGGPFCLRKGTCGHSKENGASVGGTAGVCSRLSFPVRTFTRKMAEQGWNWVEQVGEKSGMDFDIGCPWGHLFLDDPLVPFTQQAKQNSIHQLPKREIAIMPDASCFSLSTIDWLPSPSNSALKISSLHPSTTTDCGVYPFSPEWVKLPPIGSPYLQSHSFLTCPLSCLHGHLFQRPEVIMLFLFNNFLGPLFGTRESPKSIAWRMILMTVIFLFVFSANISVYLLFFWKKK